MCCTSLWKSWACVTRSCAVVDVMYDEGRCELRGRSSRGSTVADKTCLDAARPSMHAISDLPADSSNRSTSKVSIAMPVSVEKADRPMMLILSEASMLAIAERLPNLSMKTHKSSMTGRPLRGEERGCHEISIVVLFWTSLWMSSWAYISRSCTLVGVRNGGGRCASGAGALSMDLWEVVSRLKGALAAEVDWGRVPSRGLGGSSQDDLRRVVDVMGTMLADALESPQGAWPRSLARSLPSSRDLLNVSSPSIEVGDASAIFAATFLNSMICSSTSHFELGDGSAP